MPAALRILIVEDSADDLALMLHELSRSGLTPDWQQVETADEMRVALAEEQWDVVLSDHTLPGFGAAEALTLCRDADPVLPFIVVSGTIGDDRAVAMMRAGVSDYLFKDNLARLVPVIEREIREAENRRGRRRAEQAALHLAAVVAYSDDAVLSKTLDGRVTSWNPAAERLYGWTAVEAIGRHISFIVPPERLDELARTMEGLQRGERGEAFETVRLRKDGTRVQVSVRVSAVRDGTGQLIGISKFARDVTAKKLVEEMLARDAMLLANVQDSLIVTDLQGVVTYWNDGATRLFGWSAREMLGRPLVERLPEEARPAASANIAAIAAGAEWSGEWEDCRKDGSRVWIDARAALILDRAGQAVGIMGVSQDISARKSAEAELQRTLRRLELHIERMPLACVLFDTDVRILEWNPAAERIFGYRKDEIIGRSAFETIVPETARAEVEANIRRVQSGDMAANQINANRTKDGRIILCEWFNTPFTNQTGEIIGCVSLADDITEKRLLEEQFHQAQKMEAFGQLAGGVAHDFNNLLTVISGYSEMMLATARPDDPNRELLQGISQAGERAAMLTRQLLAFSRKQVVQPQVLDLNSVVANAKKMLGRLIGEDVNLTTVLAPGLERVKADPGQLEQVIMNLVVNARDAMPQGGQITIETGNIDLDANYTRSHAEVQPGRYVMLAVSDTGGGMTDEVKQHLFEPFFTTKEPGKGTGLGLATVFGIVKQSGGHVALYSEVNHGATFKIYLPAVQDVVPATHDEQKSAPAAAGTETILLVEDEAPLRAMTRLALETNGYTLLDAAGGLEAIRLCEEHPGPIHLLVSDVVMPQMGGRLLAERLTALRPEMRVLFVSGYTDDAVVRHGVLQAEVAFLQKPFSMEALHRKVRAVLDGTD